MRKLFGVIGVAAAVIAVALVMRDSWHSPEAGGIGSAAIEAGGTGSKATAAGVTDAAEIIEARRVLMLRIEQLMQPIDAFTLEEKGDLPALRVAGGSIEAMMLAFPHLFPPATNVYDATVRETPTTALPAIWSDGSAFRSLAEEAERAAAAIAQSEDAASMRTAARSLRASCDGCHTRFMKAYTPPKVTQEDREFDFDSVFQKK